METILQVFDCDYIADGNGRPTIRIFGKTEKGESVTVFYKNFKPYFYILPRDWKATEEELGKNFKEVEKIDAVQRFLPIGFSKERVDLMKVTLTDPSKTPMIRDHMKKLPCVEEIFEADILFRYRFMADFGIFGMRWVKVGGEPIRTTIAKTTKRIEAESVEPVEMAGNAPMKHLSLDIEIASKDGGLPEASKDPIIMISLAFSPNFNSTKTLVLVAKRMGIANSETMEFTDEKEMLAKLLEIFERYDPDIITGYNINSFDLPYINERMMRTGVARTLGRCSQKPMNSRKIGIKSLNSVTGRIVVDPYVIIKEMSGRGFFVGLKRYSLESVSQHLFGEGKVEINKNDIPKLWNGKREDVKLLSDYARKDAVLALRILLEKQMINKYVGISMVSGVLLQDALDSGESTKVENLLLREFNRDGFVIPNRPDEDEVARRDRERETRELKGAYVLDPINGLHTNATVYLDFMSMYPSIYIGYNICPTTLVSEKDGVVDGLIKTPYGATFAPTVVRQGIIPRIVKNLIEERAKIKAEMKKERDEEKLAILDARQEGLKRMSNAFYGYTGFMMARLYVLDVASAITSCGRYYINRTKELVEGKTRHKVIYGDTDSVMVETDTKDMDEAMKKGDELAKLINDEYKGTMRIKVENIFRSLLILTKKRYAGWSFEKVGGEWKEKTVMKGIETVRRDWCNLVSEVLTNTLNIILKEQNPEKAVSYMKDIVQKLQDNKIELDKLVITKGITKRPEEYKGMLPHINLAKKMKERMVGDAPTVGDRIGFVIVKGLQSISERAEDPEYIRQHNLKVDPKYYIENQLLPPLERVFEAMGIDKGELFRVGKQMMLSQLLAKPQEKAPEVLTSVDGVICDKCGTTFGYIPLIGKCAKCGGELSLFSGETKSKTLKAGSYLKQSG